MELICFYIFLYNFIYDFLCGHAWDPRQKDPKRAVVKSISTLGKRPLQSKTIMIIIIDYICKMSAFHVMPMSFTTFLVQSNECLNHLKFYLL